MNNARSQHLAQLREWFIRNDRSWWADKTDEQLLNETRLDCYRSNVREPRGHRLHAGT